MNTSPTENIIPAATASTDSALRKASGLVAKPWYLCRPTVRPFAWAWALSLSVLIALALTGLAQFLRAGQAESMPEALLYDFGEAKDGEKISHVFQIYNSSRQPLHVLKVGSSCRCTVAQGTPKIIAPRENGVFPVEVTTAADSEFQSEITVLFKDRPMPVRLVMKGRVILQYPRDINFGTFRRGEAQDATIIVHAVGNRSLRLARVDYDREYFDVSGQQFEGNSRDLAITIRMQPTAPSGDFAQTIGVVTNDDLEPTKSIRVHGRVLGLVEISPTELAFSKPNESQSVRIWSPYNGVIDEVVPIKDTVSAFAVSEIRRTSPSELFATVALGQGSLSERESRNVVSGTVTLLVRSEGREERKAVRCLGVWPQHFNEGIVSETTPSSTMPSQPNGSSEISGDGNTGHRDVATPSQKRR